ncbi:MAG TPA: hypothetical protein VNZ57_06575 [Longimicrobiales bacterium]|nr:hypothetical protein [Longimicrobiales bacterium]
MRSGFFHTTPDTLFQLRIELADPDADEYAARMRPYSAYEGTPSPSGDCGSTR